MFDNFKIHKEYIMNTFIKAFMTGTIITFLMCSGPQTTDGKRKTGKLIKLKSKVNISNVALDEAIRNRKSERSFDQSKETTKVQLEKLLFAAQGITHGHYRTTPSAGALYPLDVYLMINNVKSISKGIYRFSVKPFSLQTIVDRDVSDVITEAALGQSMIKNADVVFIIVSTWERVTKKYGKRGRNYAFIEAGHIGQNLMLTAAALQMKSVPVGAFHEEVIAKVFGLDAEKETPIYIICAGN